MKRQRHNKTTNAHNDNKSEKKIQERVCVRRDNNGGKQKHNKTSNAHSDNEEK
jgi:hypothetical protein